MRMLGWIVAGGMVAAAPGLSAQRAKPNDQPEKDRLSKMADEAMAKMVAQLFACPVGFRAEIAPRLTLREAKNGQNPVDGTMLRLSLLTSDAVDPKKTIVSANVTAHGVAPAGLSMLVGGSSGEKRTQAFEVKWAFGAPGRIESELMVTQVPFVRWVELNRIAYQDGSVWNAAEGMVCRAELSEFHPI